MILKSILCQKSWNLTLSLAWAWERPEALAGSVFWCADSATALVEALQIFSSYSRIGTISSVPRCCTSGRIRTFNPIWGHTHCDHRAPALSSPCLRNSENEWQRRASDICTASILGRRSWRHWHWALFMLITFWGLNWIWLLLEVLSSRRFKLEVEISMASSRESHLELCTL